VNAEEFDLVILDLMLPGRDGLQVLSTLRKRGLQTPVLILTARDAIEDRVQVLDSGANDYLVKPFAFPELLARVRARLRRVRFEKAPVLTLADLTVDVLNRHASRNGHQGAFEQLRRFTADASHELRTPVTAIRSVGEVALQAQRTATEYRDTIGSMLEEVDRLTHLVENLLILSRADAGHIQLHKIDISLLSVAHEAASMLEVLPEE
jgi:signal transduction histidine kinase